MKVNEHEGRNYAFFQNLKCEWFPCHNNIDKEEFNCLFCYCPLYALGKNCKGNPIYIKGGIKDCSSCVFPHKKDNYDLVVERLSILINDVASKENE